MSNGFTGIGQSLTEIKTVNGSQEPARPGSVDAFHFTSLMNSVPKVPTREDTTSLALNYINTGGAQFDAPNTSAEDQSNSFMFSDDIRFNFETNTLQVLAERPETGELAWMNIDDVSDDVALNTHLELEQILASDNQPDQEDPSPGYPADLESSESHPVNTSSNDSETTSVVGTNDDGLGSDEEWQPVTSDSGSNGPEPGSPVVDGGTVTAVTEDGSTVEVDPVEGNITVTDQHGEPVADVSFNPVTGETEHGELPPGVEVTHGSVGTPSGMNPSTAVQVNVDGRPITTVVTESDVGENPSMNTGPMTVLGPGEDVAAPLLDDEGRPMVSIPISGPVPTPDFFDDDMHIPEPGNSPPPGTGQTDTADRPVQQPSGGNDGNAPSEPGTADGINGGAALPGNSPPPGTGTTSSPPATGSTNNSENDTDGGGAEPEQSEPGTSDGINGGAALPGNSPSPGTNNSPSSTGSTNNSENDTDGGGGGGSGGGGGGESPSDANGTPF